MKRVVFFVLIVLSSAHGGDQERGRAFYQARGCVSCHGEDGRGGSLGPHLAGQFDWYLASSLEKFSRGERPDTPNKDHAEISPHEGKNVAAYLAGLRQGKD